MLKIFLSSTYEDLKGVREETITHLENSVTILGMEKFLVDERSIMEKIHVIDDNSLKNADICLFLITTAYGSLIENCEVLNKCSNDQCPFKLKNKPKLSPKEKISYTHCEYLCAKNMNKPRMAFKFGDKWDIYKRIIDTNWNFKNDPCCEKIITSEGFEKYECAEIKKIYNRISYLKKIESDISEGNYDKVSEKNLDSIFDELVKEIYNRYFDSGVQFDQFVGRKEDIKIIRQAIDNRNSIVIWGPGGIGKTTIIQIVLLIEQIRNKNVIGIGLKRGYKSGSGYVINKFSIPFHELEKKKINLEDIAKILHLKKRKNESKSKFSERIIKTIDQKKIILFIDDLQNTEKAVKDLLKYNGAIISSSRKFSEESPFNHEIKPLNGDELDELIELYAKRAGVNIDPELKESVLKCSEGHPILIDLIVKRYRSLSEESLNNIKTIMESSDKGLNEEILKRIVEEILDPKKLKLLIILSNLNAANDYNIDRGIIFNIINDSKEIAKNFSFLVDCGLIEKIDIKGQGKFKVKYNLIREIFLTDEKSVHSTLKQYYCHFLIEKDDISLRIEYLYHSILADANSNQIDEFFELVKERRWLYGNSLYRLLESGNKLENYIDDDFLKGRLYSSIALIHLKMYNLKDSEKYLKKSCQILEKVKDKNSDEFQSDIAQLYHDYGKLYWKNNFNEHAIEYYNKALNIRKELVGEEDTNSPFLSDLAQTYNNLGIIYRRETDYKNAKECYNEALKIRKELVGEEDTNSPFLPDLAQTYNNLGVVYRREENYECAESYFNEALKIREQLADKDPDRYRSALSVTYNTLGTLYRNLDELEASEDSYKKALQCREWLADKDPNVFLPSLSTTYSGIGLLYSKKGSYGKSKNYLEKSLKIRKELAKREPHAFLPNLIKTHKNLGFVCQKLKQQKKSEEHFNDALRCEKEYKNLIS